MWNKFPVLFVVRYLFIYVFIIECCTEEKACHPVRQISLGDKVS